ncbi:MAG: DUF2029 domain-containing protein [Sphingomonadales bacterium]|nr:MAG: DUF2029 domain-containing protein [Sphingomonadales bacterium]
MSLFADRKVRMLFWALALTCSLGWLFKGHCTAGGWSNSEQYTTGCYSDAIPFWTAREIDKGKIPYLESRMEYPVLTGATIYIEGVVARTLFGKNTNAAEFLAVVTIVNALLAALVLRLFVLAGMDSRRLWMWALAPPLILYVGHNWDMVAVTLAVAAMLAARRNRLVAAAALAGLGTAAKLWPVLMLPLIGLGALFETGRSWRQRPVRATIVTAAAIGAWALVNLPFAIFANEYWSEFYRFSEERGGTAAGTWSVLNGMGWIVTAEGDQNRLASILFLVGAGAIVAGGWQRHRNHLWVLFTPVLAWFMLTNKVYSPQFDLWLYPMLLLTAPRLWPVGLFMIGGIGAYFAEFWLFAAQAGAHPAAQFADVACAAVLRGAAMVWIIVDLVRRDPPEWITTASKV